MKSLKSIEARLGKQTPVTAATATEAVAFVKKLAARYLSEYKPKVGASDANSGSDPAISVALTGDFGKLEFSLQLVHGMVYMDVYKAPKFDTSVLDSISGQAMSGKGTQAGKIGKQMDKVEDSIEKLSNSLMSYRYCVSSMAMFLAALDRGHL